MPTQPNTDATTEQPETTESVLHSLLTENTGRHFLDSGGAYGRHWERNQERDFDAELETSLHFSICTDRDGKVSACFEITHSVYHWLSERLDFNPELDAQWQAFQEKRQEGGQLYEMSAFVEALGEGLEHVERECFLDGGVRGQDLGRDFGRTIDRHSLDRDAEGDTEDWAILEAGPMIEDSPYWETLDALLDEIRSTDEDTGAVTTWELEDGDIFQVETTREEPRNVGGIYGEGEPVTVNTYNGEDLLSQTLQYVFWTDDDGEHVLLQVHGGCDVRGGYTDARVFDLREELAIFDNARACLYVDSDTVPEWPTEATPLLPGMEEPNPDERPDSDAFSWYTEDAGYHWYGDARELMPDGSYNVPDMGDFPVLSFEEDEHGEQRCVTFGEHEGQTLDAMRLRGGFLCIDDDGNGYCPLTGGKLCAGPY